MKSSSQIYIGEGHNCLVEEEALIDNFWYLDGKLGFWDIDFFGNLAMEIGNSEEDFGTVKLGLDKQEGVLGRSTTL